MPKRKRVKKSTSKKPLKNANRKAKAKKIVRPRSKRFTGSRKKVIKHNKTRKNPKAKKPAKLVSKSLAIKKRKSVSIIKASKKRNKNTTAKPYITTTENKQNNTITFKSGGQPENVAKKFEAKYNDKLIKKYLTKNRPIKDARPKEPRGIVLIVTIKLDGETKVISVRTSDTFVVTENSIIDFVSTYLTDFEQWDTIGEGSGLTLGNEDTKIVDYSIKFIY